MYPYFEIAWVTLYMTWLWIISFILANLFLIKFYSKRFNVNFWKFFSWLPLFLLLPYLLWSYFYHFFSSLLIVPMSFSDLYLIISPFWYDFSFFWITLWLAISIYLFINNVDIKTEKYKRIDIFFYSFSLSLVPLGFFLVLWDDFIWNVTTSFVWVSALMSDTVIDSYDMVYPVGIFLSLLWIIVFIIWLFLNYIFKSYWIWFFWFIVLLLLFNFIFHYQMYPKHLVFSVFDYTLDIKNYWTIILSILVFLYYIRIKSL